MRWAVIMAGGKGKRFWPLSRENNPKQFIKIKGNETFLDLSYKRAKLISDKILIVTTQNLKGKMNYEADFIIEPFGKNTAVVCLLSALYILKKDANPLIAVLPADHWIENLEEFKKSFEAAYKIAERKYLVTFGIKPIRVETGYGHIEISKLLDEIGGVKVYEVLKFHEKPDYETAQYYKSDMYKILSQYDFKDEVIPSEIYDKIEDISVDYAIMEKAERVAMIESKFFWEDLGSFTSLERVLPVDSDKNVKIGDSVSVNGVCLTVSQKDEIGFNADVMPVTMKKSTLQTLKIGSKVNLETALTLSKPLGGHLVSGHIDGTAEIISIVKSENSMIFKLSISSKQYSMLIEEGSIAVDGISLTIAESPTLFLYSLSCLRKYLSLVLK